MNPDSLPNFEILVFQRLKQSSQFIRYKDAFRLATGLPLRFMRMDEQWCLSEHQENQSPFCQLINNQESACLECIETNRRLVAEVEADGPMTSGCFSGLCATAVPVRLGATTLGFLKTGQVFRQPPKEEHFLRAFEKLSQGRSDHLQLEVLREAYFQTKTIDPKRYDSMILLLETLADQLSQQAENLAVILDGIEPEGIMKVRKRIHSKLDQPIVLSELAALAGLSESHFCRTFKQATQLTVTEYVTRARIAWARRELLRPSARVSEIAFQVGFQSLSQFNRSFVSIVGCSPTRFRADELRKAHIVPA